MNSQDLASKLCSGDRRALAQSITLVESLRADDQLIGEKILEQVISKTGQSHRICFTGMPGVGKSSLIEKFGLHAINAGRKVAVLAIDPTSPVSGGSILGDKTRMEELSKSEKSFIRPTPSGETNGGIARATRQAILLCEAAGYDLIIVETVGVGQAEYEVSGLVDTFVLLQLPGSGDELQAFKKGILELADIIAVNKSDGAMEALAKRSQIELEQAMHLITATRGEKAEWSVPILRTSAETSLGVGELYNAVTTHCDSIKKSGQMMAKRKTQSVTWFYREVDHAMHEAIKRHPLFLSSIKEFEAKTGATQVLPSSAARKLVEQILAGNCPPKVF